MDEVKAVPTTEEARSNLEKRKHSEVPSEVLWGEPRKKSTAQEED